MARAGRTNKQYAQTKASILAAAIAVLNRKGVSRMTLADVGARIGLKAPTIQYYFNKKEDLAAACLVQGLTRLSEFLAAAKLGASGRERLEMFLWAYFDFRARSARGEVEEFPSFSDARGLNLASVNEAYGDMYRQLRGLLAGAGLSPDQRLALNSAAHLLLAELHWTPLWFRNVYPEDSSRFGRRLFNILADGIAAPGADWTPAKISPALSKAAPVGGASVEVFLQAASAEINEHGYRGTSVEDIAARLNLTKGAFYHHIKTKDELVLACFERTFEVMRQTMVAAEAASATALQTLATFTATLVEHQIVGDVPLLRVSAVNTVLEPSQVAIVAGIERIETRIASVICDGIADGSIRRIDANVGANLIMGLINNADELRYFAHGISAVDAVDHYVKPLFKGLLSASGSVDARLADPASVERNPHVDAV